MALSHKYTLICDDVRREDNGKMLVIGMYNDIIVVPQIPFQLPSLAFFMAMGSDRPGSWTLKFKLQHLETGHTLVEGRAEANVAQIGTGLVPIKFGPVRFEALGIYNFSVNIEEHREPIISEFSVILPSQIQAAQQRPR